MFYLLKFLKRRFKKNKLTIIAFLILTSTILLIYLHKRDLDLNKRLKSSLNNNTRLSDFFKPDDYDVCLNNKENLIIDDEYSVKKQVLILTRHSSKSDLFTNLTKIFKYTRIKFERSNDVYFYSKNVGVIVFEDYEDYLYTRDNKKLKSYLIENNIGVIVFNTLINEEDHKELIISNCTLNDEDFVEKFLHVTKFNKQIINIDKKISKYNEKFEAIFFDKQAKTILKCSSKSIVQQILFVNNFNNIRHVFISLNNLNSIWILKLLLIDSIRYLSKGEIDIGLKRHIQIDIDDTFVAPTGSRMIAEDVYEMLRLQEELSKNYFYHNNYKFKFNLGYCGFYYQTGNKFENEADELLIENKDKFYWFDHTFKHLKTNFLNESSLIEQFEENLKFAKLHHIPMDTNYSVSPHHSGIWPIYPTLYKLWSEILSIQASSTECYPQVNPIYLRRGFIHDNIMVSPRQSASIFSYNLHFDTNDDQFWISKFAGGHLFETILYNQVSIFMTHLPNYANDRLAIYLFRNVFRFLNCWTNLKFVSLPPLKTVKKYFEINTDDNEPIWTNFCKSPSLINIWYRNNSECDRFPSVIIVGPQKTGSTALHEFLSAHPELRTNKKTLHFEETQFFNENYLMGIDWYLDLFDIPVNGSFINYEKSANYFDHSEIVPKRIRALINNPKIVILLMNPIYRAYSWYQHIKAHNNKIANNNTFFDIMMSNKANLNLYKIKERCLDPGNYYKHLKRWLKEFLPKQIYLLDADTLRHEPYKCLNELQKFFELKKFIDYRQILVFDERKSFYCVKKSTDKIKCLGSGKGRKYPEIDKNSYDYLKQYYLESNTKLKILLERHEYNIPEWLRNNNSN